MKVRTSIKKRSADDQIVRRKGRVYIINKRESAQQAAARLNVFRVRG